MITTTCKGVMNICTLNLYTDVCFNVLIFYSRLLRSTCIQIMSFVTRDNFSSSFHSEWLYFSLPNFPGSIFTTHLHNSSKNRHSALFLILGGIQSFSTMFVAFYRWPLWSCNSFSSLWSVSIINMYWILSDTFSVYWEYQVFFVLHSTNSLLQSSSR